MIKPVYVIKPFDVTASLTLVIMTAVVGYLFGYIGAMIWSKIHPQQLYSVAARVMLAELARAL